MSKIEQQAENLFQVIATSENGSIPNEVIAEWKKLGELLYKQNRPTKYALDAAMPSSAEVDSSLNIIPAGEVDPQPRQ